MSEMYAEKQFEVTEKRLDDHAERIRALEKDAAVTNERLQSLCESIEKQTRSINYLVCTVGGTVFTALIGFFFYTVQCSIFK